MRAGRHPRRIPLPPLKSRRRAGPPTSGKRTPPVRRKATPPDTGIVVGMPVPRDREYWNHHAAYHCWLLGIAADHRGDVLDVGCGEGLLALRLAPVSRSVTGID